MIDIKPLIASLNTEEQRAFVTYLKGKNKRHDTRNVNLFNAFLKDKEGLIKVEIGHNAYNALKKRLSDRLMDYVGNLTLINEAGEEVNIIKRLLLTRKLFDLKQPQLAYKILSKLEEETHALGHTSLLNEIYHTYVEFSYVEGSPDQDALLKKLEANNKSFLEQERLNMAYASVRKAYNEAEYSGNKVDLSKVIKDNYKRFKVSDAFGYNFKNLYQLALLADIEGAQRRDYYAIEMLFEEKIKEIQGTEQDHERVLKYHINLLYIVANIYFRKRSFDKSLSYLEQMHTQMMRYEKRHYKRSFPKYCTLKALNYNFDGQPEKAVEQLNELFKHTYKAEVLLPAKLVQVMISFQQGRLDEANKVISKMYRTDSWYERHLGMDWVLNKNFIEILLHVELNNVDLVESRIKAFIRRYRSYLDQTSQSGALDFLKFVKKYYVNHAIVKQDKFQKNVKDRLITRSNKEQDILLMSYYAWLKSKMEGTDLYSTTLELIHKKA